MKRKLISFLGLFQFSLEKVNNVKYEKEIQIITDEEVKKINEKASQKEKEIMTV